MDNVSVVPISLFPLMELGLPVFPHEAFFEISEKAMEAFSALSEKFSKARASLSGRIDQACQDAAMPLAETCDISSIARNSWSATLAILGKPVGQGFNEFGLVGAVFIIINSLRLINKAVSKLTNAKTAEMRALHIFSHLPAKVAYLVLGISMLALRVSLIARKALIAGVSELACMWSFLAMCVLTFGEACYSLHITYQLQDILEDKGNTALTIEMLKKLAEKQPQLVIQLIDEFYLAMINEFDLESKDFIGNKDAFFCCLNKTTKMDELLVKAKIAKLQSLAEADLEKLGLQTSEECAKNIRNFELSNKALEDCKIFLTEEVERANYNANTDAWMLLGVSAVAVAGASMGLAFTGPLGGLVDSIMTVVASLGWVNLDSSNLKKQVKDYFWEHHQNCKKDDSEYGVEGKAKFAVKTAAFMLTAPLWVVPAFLYYDVIDPAKEAFKRSVTVFSKEDAEYIQERT